MAVAYSFILKGIEPAHDDAWRDADEALRRAFWRFCVKAGLEVKDKSLAAGLDRHGHALTPIAASTRAHRHSAMSPHADPDAPPLTPAWGLSRTRSLLAGRAFKDRAEFFWRFDDHTHASWGKVLAIHRRGGGKLPVRDVIGMSPADQAEVKRRAWAWWAATVHGHGTVEAIEPAPATIPITRATPPTPAVAAAQRIVPIAGTNLARVYREGTAIGYHTQAKAAGAEGMITEGWYQKRRIGGLHHPLPTIGPKPPPFRPKPRVATTTVLPVRPAARPTPGPNPRRPVKAKPKARPAPDSPVAPKFGPSRAKVELAQERDVLAGLKQLTGRDMTHRDIASLTGATDEVTVAGQMPSGVKIYLTVDSERYVFNRVIDTRHEVPTIRNAYFEVKDQYQGQGLGTEIFARQVEQSARLGFERIVAEAERGEGYNGYYTWPRLGYDAELPPSIREQLPPEFADARMVSDLMSSPERREWWKANGRTLNMTFDLTEGSLSRRTLAAYLAERARMGAR